MEKDLNMCGYDGDHDSNYPYLENFYMIYGNLSDEEMEKIIVKQFLYENRGLTEENATEMAKNWLNARNIRQAIITEKETGISMSYSNIPVKRCCW